MKPRDGLCRCCGGLAIKRIGRFSERLAPLLVLALLFAGCAGIENLPLPSPELKEAGPDTKEWAVLWRTVCAAGVLTVQEKEDPPSSGSLRKIMGLNRCPLPELLQVTSRGRVVFSLQLPKDTRVNHEFEAAAGPIVGPDARLRVGIYRSRLHELRRIDLSNVNNLAWTEETLRSTKEDR